MDYPSKTMIVSQKLIFPHLEEKIKVTIKKVDYLFQSFQNFWSESLRGGDISNIMNCMNVAKNLNEVFGRWRTLLDA